MAKSAKLALQAAAIMMEQLKRVQAPDTKVAKKRNIKVKYITQRESLMIKEAIEISQEAVAPAKATQSRGGDAPPKASSRAPRHCSGCRSTEHTAKTCPALIESCAI